MFNEDDRWRRRRRVVVEGDCIFRGKDGELAVGGAEAQAGADTVTWDINYRVAEGRTNLRHSVVDRLSWHGAVDGWRRLLVQQPPVPETHLRLRLGNQSETEEVDHERRRGGGGRRFGVWRWPTEKEKRDKERVLVQEFSIFLFCLPLLLLLLLLTQFIESRWIKIALAGSCQY